jgi:hypothetical protein
VDIEGRVAKPGIGTNGWIRNLVFAWQYKHNIKLNPITGEIGYDADDSNARIITRCVVTPNANRVVFIKVAKNDPPEPLSDDERNQLDFYLKQTMFEGVQYKLISSYPDRLGVYGTVYFDGQYSTTIKNAVVNSLNEYCKSISTTESEEGIISVSDVQMIIFNTPGVKGFKMDNLYTRIFGGLDTLILYDLSEGVNLNSIASYSGSLVQEDDSGHDWLSTLEFMPV